MTVIADSAYLTGLERGLRGPSWRVDPYPTPGALYAALEPDAVETAALRLLDKHLVAIRDGDIDRLLVSIGPQEGKTSRISLAFPLWLLLDNPDRRVMCVSYEKEIATRNGRQVRNAITTHDGTDGTLNLHLRVKDDTRAADRWQLDGYRGGMVTAGIGGALTGRPADVLVVDDPYRDRAAAWSRKTRKSVEDAWRTTLVPRLAPGAPVVVLHTRWREDDLMGHLLKTEPGRWVHLNITAISVGAGDALGRPEGVWLDSARGRTPQQWEDTRKSVGEYDFAALYQGQPKPAEGGMFKRATFLHWQPTRDPWQVIIGTRPNHPVDLRLSWRFATVDLAASTRSSADWTVAAVWAVADTGELILIDLARAQVAPEKHWDDVVAPLVDRWGCKLFVEGSQWGTDLIYSAGREGAALEKLVADSDKYTRAVPAARRIGQGRVFFPQQADWLHEFEAELEEFPNGTHDDQVDVVAYAHRVVSAHYVPLEEADQSTGPASAPVADADRVPVDMPVSDPMTVVFRGVAGSRRRSRSEVGLSRGGPGGGGRSRSAASRLLPPPLRSGSHPCGGHELGGCRGRPWTRRRSRPRPDRCPAASTSGTAASGRRRRGTTPWPW